MKLIVSSPPHWNNKDSITKIHSHLIIALLPVLIYAVYTYGLHAARIISLSVVTTIASEYFIRKLFGKESTITNGSAVVIGLLFAMLLPPSVPYWLVIMGAFLCIFIGKEIFGGLGSNPLSPVLVGWAITRISWPAYYNLDLASVNYDLGYSFRYPLTLLKKGGTEFISEFKLLDFLLGKQVGGIGTVAVLLLLIGGIYLLLRGVIAWEIPVSFMVGILVVSSVFWLLNNNQYANPLFHLFTGNLMLGIFFLSTDYASSPFNRWGMIVFGFGCGFLTIIFRVWSVYPDGVFFAILIMNLFTPLLDKLKKRSKPVEFIHIESRAE
ncbi:MAG: RnfABCDGE type electron transport complex subunit D [Candidatus Aminicenantes bacterium]|nr:RnfABCDGE type electron transport complex subunit D [Candidatus Aminicenantes bacterium]